MKVQKIQSNQQTFGTKVIMDPFAARQISLSKANRKVLNHIKSLENNGVDDTLFLSYSFGEKIVASVIEQKDGKIFMNQPICNYLRQTKYIKGGREKINKYISIIDLYSGAKKRMNEVVINGRGFTKFFPYMGI